MARTLKLFPPGLIGLDGAAKLFGTSLCTMRRWKSLGCQFTKTFQCLKSRIWVIEIEKLHQWQKENIPTWGQRRRERYVPTRKDDDPAEAGTIYALCDPISDEVRYVGKTRNLRRRLSKYKCRAHSPHLRNWIAKLSRQGLAPKIRVLEECLFGLAERERYWISFAKTKGWNLMNIADGGGSQTVTDATKAKLREIARQKWADPTYQEKLKKAQFAASAAKRGLSIGQYKARKTLRHVENFWWRKFGNALRAKRRKDKQWMKTRASDRKQQLVPLTYKGSAFLPLNGGKWAIIDCDDWERTIKMTWGLQIKHGHYGKTYFRAKTNIRLSEGKQTALLLNRFIAQAQNDQIVRHGNGVQLDCRKQNLVVEKSHN